MELQIIQNKIYEIREQRVMLNFDLANMYETETKRLKEAVRRNINRFPTDFMFELTNQEYTSLRSQFVTLKSLTNDITNCDFKLRRLMIFTKHLPRWQVKPKNNTNQLIKLGFWHIKK